MYIFREPNPDRPSRSTSQLDAQDPPMPGRTKEIVERRPSAARPCMMHVESQAKRIRPDDDGVSDTDSDADNDLGFVKLTDEQKQTLLSVKWVRDEVDKMLAKAAQAKAADDVMLLHYVETKVYVSGRVECNQGRRYFKRSSETTRVGYRAGWFDFGELPYSVQSDIDKEGYKILYEEDEDQQLSLYQLVLIKTQDA